MTMAALRPNLEYPTCMTCGQAHGYRHHFGRPSQCPVCPSASPPVAHEEGFTCLACRWEFRFDEELENKP